MPIFEQTYVHCNMVKKISFLLILFSFIFIGCNKEQPPKVSTRIVTEITDQSAKCGGNVTSIGDAILTGRGVCWNTTGTPTTADMFTLDGADVGDYASYLTNLSPNTKYYVRAYAKNIYGMSYGKETTFITQALNARDQVIGKYNGYDTVTYQTPPGSPYASAKSFSITTGNTLKDTIYLSSFGPTNMTLMAYYNGSSWILPDQYDQVASFKGFKITVSNKYFYAAGYIDNGPSRLYYSFWGNK
jgi:hypothetical protein